MIAKILGYSSTTVGNEFKRGTLPRKSNKGRTLGYFAKQDEVFCKANRKVFNFQAI
jgi:hypothetical protein